jgi:hypothetical protein
VDAQPASQIASSGRKAIHTLDFFMRSNLLKKFGPKRRSRSGPFLVFSFRLNAACKKK